MFLRETSTIPKVRNLVMVFLGGETRGMARNASVRRQSMLAKMLSP